MKALKPYTDFPALDTMRKEMDRFFDDLVPFSWRKENGGMGMDLWVPDTDLSETENDYLITVDLPGISKKNIEVNYKDNRLTITGEREKEESEEKKDFIRKERYTGKFIRSFTLPDAVKRDNIKANFKDGVLTVKVPKKEVKKPQNVPID